MSQEMFSSSANVPTPSKTPRQSESLAKSPSSMTGSCAQEFSSEWAADLRNKYGIANPMAEEDEEQCELS